MSAPFDLVPDPHDPRILHAPWCAEHVNYDPERSPQDGVCAMPFYLEFPPAKGDDLATAEIDLWFTPAEVGGFSPSVALLGFNGSEYGSHMIDLWKAPAVAYALLACWAKGSGDDSRAASFMAEAQGVIDAHEAEGQSAPAYVVAEPKAPTSHWSQGPFHHVEGLDAGVDCLPWTPEGA
jgi:hypothetical protein